MMGIQHLDQYSAALIFLFTAGFLLLFIEIGYRLGNKRQGKAYKLQTTQFRALMTTTLGLIAFVLAFTFATAQVHYETRVAGIAEEARLIHNAFLYADKLDAHHRSLARQTLREYVDLRLKLEETDDPEQWEEVFELIDETVELQRFLWDISLESEREISGGGETGTDSSSFGSSVVGIIDIHNSRIQAELANRISAVVWLALYTIAALGMILMGYHAGMIGQRSPIGTYSLAMAFAVVILLIIDLDRPMTSMFKMSNQSLVILAENMDDIISSE